MKNLLITGATGFIGSHLVKTLLKTKKYKIRIFIRLESNLNRLKEVLDQIEVFNGNFLAEEDIRKSLKGIDIFLHLASVLGRGKNEDYRNFNINASERFFYYCVQLKVKKVIFLSSFEVNSGSDTLTYYTENGRPNPVTPYGKSKYNVEKIAEKYIRDRGLNITILRVPAVYGPEDNFDRGFIRIIDLIAKNIFIPFWDMKNYMALIYIENLIDAIKTCMENKKSDKKLYFVQDKELLMVKDAYSLMVKLCNARKSKIHIPKIFMIFLEQSFELFGRIFNFLPPFPRKFVHNIMSNYACSIDKIKKELNWTPPISFYEGMRRTVKWYKEQKK